MSNEVVVFHELSKVDVKPIVQTKGAFEYLSWSNAVREMLKLFPTATWEFGEWESLPYLKTEVGYFVTCSVTINGITRKQMMPILDFKNKAVMIGKLTSDQVNKAQMRALAKAIALHGLGLDLWAGEDLMPTPEELALASKRANLTRTELAKFMQESGYTAEGVCQSFGVTDFKELDVQVTFDAIVQWNSQKG